MLIILEVIFSGCTEILLIQSGNCCSCFLQVRGKIKAFFTFYIITSGTYIYRPNYKQREQRGMGLEKLVQDTRVGKKGLSSFILSTGWNVLGSHLRREGSLMLLYGGRKWWRSSADGEIDVLTINIKEKRRKPLFLKASPILFCFMFVYLCVPCACCQKCLLFKARCFLFLFLF